MIWKYENIAKNIKPEFRLTLNEGDTPFEKLELDGKEITIKREDLNPNGSFKDRSLAYQLSHYIQQGKRKFVLGSSGNAGASAAAYINLASKNYTDVDLNLYKVNKIPEYKLKKIQVSDKVRIIDTKNPKSEAMRQVREEGRTNLRGSVDPNAVVGFKSLGYEIAANDDYDALFVCCSSGTSTKGIYEGIVKMNVNLPQVHIVQSTKIHPIAKEFDSNFEQSTSSLANAIADRVAKRKNSVLKIINETGGFGWVVSDDDLKDAKMVGQKAGLNVIGYNAYVGLAGYLKAVRNGRNFENPLVLVSGV